MTQNAAAQPRRVAAFWIRGDSPPATPAPRVVHIGEVESAEPTWRILEHGPFMTAECGRCGWKSPARRAYSSAVRNGEEHASQCPAADATDDAAAT